jgi:hypothetical protein
MKQLLLRVSADRSTLGILSIGSGSWSVAASAMSDPASNLPDPAVGRYRLIRSTEIPEAFEEARRAYGEKMLFFQVDQTVIPLHAGDLAGSGKLLPTDGGIRLSGEDFRKLIEQIGDDADVRLEILETKEIEAVSAAAGERVKVSRQPAPRPIRRASSSPSLLASSVPTHHHHTSFGDDIWFWYWMFSDSGNHHHHDYPPADTHQEIPAEVRTDGYGEDPPAEKAEALAPDTLPVVSPDFLPVEEVQPPQEGSPGDRAEAPPEGEAADASTAEAPTEDGASDASGDDSSGTSY